MFGNNNGEANKMYEGNYFLCGDFKESEWNSFVFVFFSLLESIVPPSDRKKLIVE